MKHLWKVYTKINKFQTSVTELYLKISLKKFECRLIFIEIGNIIYNNRRQLLYKNSDLKFKKKMKKKKMCYIL